ncbi:MAG: BBP7 family outer membrane beta-barrel protein [Planctomycetales bacterium]
MSVVLALFGAGSTALADEPDTLELAQYSEPMFGGSAEQGGESFDDEDMFSSDPRYDWDLSEGPTDVNQFFATPELTHYFQADALWLARAHTVDTSVAVTLPPGSHSALSSQDASLSGQYAIGTILTLGRRIDQVSAVELTFWGFNTWDSSAQATGPGNLSIPGTLALVTQDYIFADRIKIDYNSTIYTTEANYLQSISGMTLLAGFRYVRLNEGLDLNSRVDALNSSSDYTVKVKNNLIGGQLGLGFSQQWDRLVVDLLGKFGVFANVAQQNTQLWDVNNTVLRRNWADNTISTSVLGEIALNGTYHVTDWLSVRAGYRFLWINNVAAAPSQLDFNDSVYAGKTINAQEYLYLHGVNLGLEARW